MTEKTKQQLQADVASTFETNTTGAITASDLRTYLLDELDSVAFLTDVSGDLQYNNGTASSGTVTLLQSNGTKQKLTVGGAITIAFGGWPASGTYGEIELELIDGGLNITWPAVNWLIGDGSNSPTFSSMGVTLNISGTNFVVVWSCNGGTTFWGRAV